jgi:hypothetical protein
MAQTVLEINTATSDLKNEDASYFSQVFGEPIHIKAGSTIDFMNGFLDLGSSQIDEYILIPNKIRLGLNFYRYEMDVPQLPASEGADGKIHDKRFIYWVPAAVDIPDPTQEASIIDQPVLGGAFPDIPPTQYGCKSNMYSNTNLPAFLMKRTNQSVGPDTTTPNLPANAKMRTDTFEVQEEYAEIDIPAGYYSKVKFCQLVNDGFNLVNGSLTNFDKPLENVTPVANPTKVTGLNTVSPYDYQLPPNVQNQILKAFEYSHALASVKAADPDSITSETKYFVNDRTWDYWFCPVNTIPATNYVEEGMNPPYIWYNTQQTGFMAGASKFNLNWDSANDFFFIDYLHTPMLDTEQREVVLFSKAKTFYDNYQSVGYKAIGSLGGIMLSRLYSYEFDNAGNPITKNTNFWQNVLGFTGFDDAYRQEVTDSYTTISNTFYNNYRLDGSQKPPAYGVTYKFEYTYPDLKYLDIGSTRPLIPMQWLQQSNFAIVTADKGMSIYSSDIAKIFQSIGNRVIQADAGAYTKPDPYYLIEINISHLKNDNYRDRDTYRQIMSIAGKTYSSGSNYIQLFADNSIQALNLTEDIYIDKIEIKILNSDKTLATNLGDNSSIFLRITQPVIMDQPQTATNSK